MNYLTKTILRFLLLILCHGTNAQQVQPSITGQVTDSQNKPVDAALVWLVTSDGATSVALLPRPTAGLLFLVLPKK